MGYKTWGQVFPVGEIPAGKSVTGSVYSVAKSVQCNRMSSHPDGSLRHAILTYDATPGDSLILSSSHTALSGASLTRSDLPANFSVAVSIDVAGDALYSGSMTKEDIVAATVRTHISGPLCSEWIVVGSVSHPHITPYYHVRLYADGNVRVDVVVENGWSFVSGPSDFTYDCVITLSGTIVKSAAVTHFHHARWHEVFWVGTDPSIHARQDYLYLQNTKAVPRYTRVTPSEAYLDGLTQTVAPMDNGDHTNNMDGTGYQPAIGPLPQWDATYCVNSDRRSQKCVEANSAGGAAYGIHYRDEVTGLPISIDNYPGTSFAQNGTPSFPSALVSATPYYKGSGYSHQPSIGYLAYLTTGDYFHLEEMQFWSAFNLMWTHYNNGGIWYTGSLRGQAWAYRSLAQCVYITPDSHPLKSYFSSKLDLNIAFDKARYGIGGTHENILGTFYMYEGNTQYRFYAYFFIYVMQMLVDLGFTEATEVRDYGLRFVQGIMGYGLGDYCYQGAPQYTWNCGPTDATWFADFGEMFAATHPTAIGETCNTAGMAVALGVGVVGQMTGSQSSATSYFSNFLPCLAAYYDASATNGRAALTLAKQSGVWPDYTDNPLWAVEPRTYTPQWFADMEPGTWYEVPSSNLSAVYPSPIPPGNSGPGSVMSAWSGGAYDTTRDRLIIHGGGHADYSGNEVYAFDVYAGEWERLSEPSSDVGGDYTISTYPDGNPRSTHTRNRLVYSPETDSLIQVGMVGGYPQVWSIQDLVSFNMVSRSWTTTLTKIPTNVGPSKDSFSTYDPIGKRILFHGGSNWYATMSSYYPATDTWVQGIGSGEWVSGMMTSVVDTNRNIATAIGSILATSSGITTNGPKSWDLSAALNEPIERATSGNKYMEERYGPGFIFDPVRDKYVGWSGGSDIYELDPITWVWTLVAAAAANTVTPTAPAGNGTFGRFQYISSLGAYIVVNKTTENVFIYKPF